MARTILVVDDEQTLRETLVDALEADGFRVVAILAQGETGTPVRFETLLAPGQGVVLSTPRDEDAVGKAIEISRRDDRVLAQDAAVTN